MFVYHMSFFLRLSLLADVVQRPRHAVHCSWQM